MDRSIDLSIYRSVDRSACLSPYLVLFSFSAHASASKSCLPRAGNVCIRFTFSWPGPGPAATQGRVRLGLHPQSTLAAKGQLKAAMLLQSGPSRQPLRSSSRHGAEGLDGIQCISALDNVPCMEITHRGEAISWRAHGTVMCFALGKAEMLRELVLVFAFDSGRIGGLSLPLVFFVRGTRRPSQKLNRPPDHNANPVVPVKASGQPLKNGNLGLWLQKC